MSSKLILGLLVVVACVYLTTATDTDPATTAAPVAASATDDFSSVRAKRGYGHGGGGGGGGGGHGGYGGGPGRGGGARGPVYFCGYVGSKEGSHYGYGK